MRNAAALFVAGCAAWVTTASAQPLYDRVNVNLPYPVTIGQKTLPPGDYTFQQLPSSSGDSRVVLVYSDGGMKFQTSALSIPALDPNTARDTKLVLDQVGNDYYLDKIWVQGKDYGYEFPLPSNVKSRQKELQQSTLAARNTPSSSTETSASTTTEQNTEPATSATSSSATESAQQTTPPPVEQSNPQPMQSATPPAQQAEPSTPTSEQGSADRAADNTNDTNAMPHSSAGWLLTLLSGGTLSGAGLMLRRRR